MVTDENFENILSTIFGPLSSDKFKLFINGKEIKKPETEKTETKKPFEFKQEEPTGTRTINSFDGLRDVYDEFTNKAHDASVNANAYSGLFDVLMDGIADLYDNIAKPTPASKPNPVYRTATKTKAELLKDRVHDILDKANKEKAEAKRKAEVEAKIEAKRKAAAEAKRKEYEARTVKQLQNLLTTAIDQEKFTILTDDVDAPRGGIGVSVNKALMTLFPLDQSVAQTVIDKAVGNIVTEYGFSDSDTAVSSDSISAYFYF
jgi:hypothetical protein